MENLLLLFTQELPCWNHEAVAVAGEDPENLDALVQSGDLAKIGGAYVLTEKGVLTRKHAAEEMYLPVTPTGQLITEDTLAAEMLDLNIMVQYMDRAFVTDWGVKEVTVREVFPVMPSLADDEYFAFEAVGRVKALWLEHELVRDFLEAFPNWGVSARKFPAPDQKGLDAWAEARGLSYGTLTVDFVMRARADFNHYKNYPQLESDRYRFLDADRLFVQKVSGNFEGLLPFMKDDRSLTLEFFSRRMIRVLEAVGVNAELEFRHNDILADGVKVSGAAQYHHGGVVLHHGTLLFEADVSVIPNRVAVNSMCKKGRFLSPPDVWYSHRPRHSLHYNDSCSTTR